MTIWGWALLGAGSWALAVALKVAADVVVQRSTTVALQDWLAALLSGVWSSLCELGLAAFAFWYWSATFADALVLATGAALAEFLVLLPAAISANWSKKQSQKKQSAGWSAFYTERAVAIANHLAARALMWLGVASPVGPAAVGGAVGLFALSESVQAYAQAKEWDFLNRRILISVLLFQIVIICAEIALLVMWTKAAS